VKNRSSVFTALGFFALFVSACGGIPATTTPTPIPVSLPVCDAADLVASNLLLPANQAINPDYGQEVITEIQYPDANCIPESFEKLVSIEPSFVEPNNISNPGPVNIPADPGEFWGSGQLTIPLDDCTQYFWKARAQVGATSGPFSAIWTFYTNFSGTCEVPPVIKPVCEPVDLIAPIIIAPLNNEVNPVYGSEVITHVSYPDANCTPEYFEKYVTTDAAFAGVNMIVNPSPINIFESNFGSGQLTKTLTDCTQFFFRARAMAAGVLGPFSETVTFVTNFNGTCQLPSSFLSGPFVVAKVDANCREGDTTAHRNIGTLLEGQESHVLGINPQLTHIKIKDPDSRSLCWVWLDLVDLFLGDEPLVPGDLPDYVDVLSIPPVPTAPPEPLDEAQPEATEVTVPICADGIDNDGDGYTDYLYDRECSSQLDNDEAY
jgi:hypothetical protein